MQLDVEVSPPANFKGSSSPLKQNAFPSQISYLFTRDENFPRYDFLCSDITSSLNLVKSQADIHTESNTYEPTIHTCRWAKK